MQTGEIFGTFSVSLTYQHSQLPWRELRRRVRETSLQATRTCTDLFRDLLPGQELHHPYPSCPQTTNFSARLSKIMHIQGYESIAGFSSLSILTVRQVYILANHATSARPRKPRLPLLPSTTLETFNTFSTNPSSTNSEIIRRLLRRLVVRLVEMKSAMLSAWSVPSHLA